MGFPAFSGIAFCGAAYCFAARVDEFMAWFILHFCNCRGNKRAFTIYFNPGIGYWLNIVYGYMLIAATFVLLIRTYITTTTFYRRQIGYFLVGILIPWLGDIVYVLFLRRVGSIDIAPVTFTLSGMVIAVGLYRYRLLDLMPVARSKLVEMTEDAWIVLDINDRLVDLNAAASSILRRKRNTCLV